MSILKQTRVKLFTKPLFNLLNAKGLLPKISQTEKTALRAGDVWVEGELFSGHPDFAKIFSYPYPKLTQEEEDFLENEVEELCTMCSDWQIFQERDLPEEVWKFLKERRFFGMIIPKEYGGLGFSAYGHSCVIEKLASYSQVLAITVMVPNSLGPAELLLHYGLQEQQDYYLPRLADGREIPCFALTEPNAGSDAGSISSSGVLFRDEEGELAIRLNFEKRYITLSAIATVIGLAFVLKDPENLLGRGEDLGITCALVEASKEGIDQTRRHDPMGVPFVNAPLKGKDVLIKVSDVIGGEKGIGNGWSMLMESLAVGRGISLPSTSTGGSKLATFVASTYAVVRYQFGLGIGKFEGVAEVLGRMAMKTYLLDSAKTFTLGAIDNGAKPAVANAIMKYQSTEMFRENIIDAMDIQGGSAISRGPKNLLAHAYYGAPVAITVEGANIMTRTLIQFGQGMIRCHPYAYAQIEALENGDVEAFDTLLFKHIWHVKKNAFRACLLGLSRGHLHRRKGAKSIGRYEQKLAWASAKFAFMADVALCLMGADLKRRESVSGRFADILAQMYLLTSALKRFQEEGERAEDERLLKLVMTNGFNAIDEAFAGIYANLSGGVLGYLFRFKGFCSKINRFGGELRDVDLHALAHQVGSDEALRNRLCHNIYRGGRVRELSLATFAMQGAKEARAKAKQGEALSDEEKKLLQKANRWQEKIVEVDSFTLDEYRSK